MCSGSSPLARGLRARFSDVKGQFGIIPARAGFTCEGGEHVAGEWDHPRSRGVYTGGDGFEWGVDGSSPLARGLRLVFYSPNSEFGIIPARAGFTPLPLPLSPSRGDHPRSRGVYRGRMSPTSILLGSSPLARGLQTEPARSRTQDRIIPARAGFTPSRSRHCGRDGDHPRSRGVYIRYFIAVNDDEGSSPLARGLP